MPVPGAIAITEHGFVPSVANQMLAWPVRQPTSTTADPSSIPVIAAGSANSWSG